MVSHINKNKKAARDNKEFTKVTTVTKAALLGAAKLLARLERDISFTFCGDMGREDLVRLITRVINEHPIATYLSKLPPAMCEYIRKVCGDVIQLTGIREEDVISYLAGELTTSKMVALMTCQCPCRHNYRLTICETDVTKTRKPWCGCCRRHESH